MKLDFMQTDVLLHAITRADVREIYLMESEQYGHEKQEALALYDATVAELNKNLCP